MNKDWETILDEFLESATWVKPPDAEDDDSYGSYFWENFKEANEYIENNAGVNIFTILDVDGGLVLVKGMRFVNRFAYLLTHDKPVLPDEEIYWYKEEDEE